MSARSVRDPTKLLEGHYNITEVDPNTSEPLMPKANARKFIKQCGVVVRDRVPINIREWKERKDNRTIPFVSDIEKWLLWEAITEHFTVLDGANVELVKIWALKKMATQF
jgi:hypothetical protein